MVENRLISKITQTREIRRVLERGLTEAHFTDCSGEWDLLTTHFRDYRETPTLATIRERFPNFIDVADVAEPVDYYIDRVREKREYQVLADTLQSASRLLGENPSLARTELETAVRRMYSEVAEITDSPWTADTFSRYENYAHFRDTLLRDGILGVSTPWAGVNELTLGFQPGQFIIFTARPKKGKSWAMCLLARHVALHDLRVLFVTMEMSPPEIIRRLDAIEAHIPYSEFRHGTLVPEHEDQFYIALEGISAVQGNIIVTASSDWAGVAGATFLEAKIRQYEPNLVIVDNAYLMHDDQGAKSKVEKYYNLTQDLKKTAQRCGVPLVITTQQGKLGNSSVGEREGGAANVQWGDAWLQNADLLFELFQTETMRIQQRMTIILHAQREGDTGRQDINWDLETMNFEELEPEPLVEGFTANVDIGE